MVYVVEELIERVEKTFSYVQGLQTLVCQQQAHFNTLVNDLCVRTKVKGPLTIEEKESLQEKVVEGKAFIKSDFALE